MSKQNSKGWQIWIDRGGTFTDIVAKSPDGQLLSHKLLSENPEQYEDAAVQGICDMLRVSSPSMIEAGKIEHVKMGTTVATNALLERKGDRTLFITTEGFGDALRIGYQSRPDLFARHIILPELLYEQVAEVSERISAKGEILRALNRADAARKMKQAYEQGIRSIAIALMHGYRYTDHEERLAELAEEIGFTQISVSHQVSPLMKLVSRGDTTVVDAYLSPILRRYVDRVADRLGTNQGENGPRLMFMQSNGGLTDARLFRGKDAILSGPAGGVVGMARTALMSNLTKLIGFDMGGTSTDVTHYDGEYERSFETMVAGVRMRAPMMHIHTVAAGGGSILSFDGSRFRVGPESAGANPGPACYRRGGPLTVTDCNVMLGKLQPEYFPKVFGKDGKQMLDAQTVQIKFEEMATQISDATGQPKMKAEQIAEGFLRIAVENMANAIKKISVQRGHDVTRYALNCFGGAGGQHACLVADALGMNTIFLHPFAGVLSAYGMGLADIRAMRQLQVEEILNTDVLPLLEKLAQPLINEAVEEVLQQGVEEEDIQVERRLHLRYEGTDTPLLIEFTEYQEMINQFETAHQRQFGFVSRAKNIVVEALSVESIGINETMIDPVVENALPAEAESLGSVDVFMDGEAMQARLFQRDELAVGQEITGPAIILEPTGTVVVETGWSAKVNERKHLLLTRYLLRKKREAIGTEADPVMLEVFNNLFMSIAEQMGVTLSNTSHSVNIKERLDFSCAIFDKDGQLVANAPHVPVHLGSMGESVKTIIRENSGTMAPGNVYALNAPYNGGTHLPDVTVISPVFDGRGENILFYVGSRGHHADIGGRTPGSSPPDSTHIEEEGVLIDNFLLVEKGELREQKIRELLSGGKFPCRNVDQNMADLAAQIAANETGIRELGRMVSQFGLDVVQAYMGHVQDNAEESVRRVVDVLHDSSFIYKMDGNREIQVAITVDRQKRQATIDFTGTSSQDKGNYNAPSAVCKAAVLYVFRTLVNDDIPLNEGCLKPLDIVIPKKTMISPEYPAAVISGNTEVSQCVTDALYGALGVLASSQGTMNNFVYGNDTYQNYETICGGTGAGPDHPGTSAVHSHMTNTRMTDPEVVEWRFPVLLEEFSIRSGSGGNGRFCGGEGVVRKMRFLEQMTTTVLSSHRETEPYGLQGGGAGQKGINYVIRADGSKILLKGNDEITVQVGDTFVIETPGGGGYGVG